LSFGERFGHLVRRYREAQGLSSGELAIEAFNDEARRSRISELENGKVSRPQARTIDALRIALAIPQEEIDALHKPSLSDRILIAEIRAEMDLATDGLLEGLALRFGIDNPDAPRAELGKFLKEKAREWKNFKTRLASVTKLDARLSNQMAAAEDAIGRGNFDEAEDILSAAEEIQQQERTLAEVRKQSQIRVARADAALFKGDLGVALTHFDTAAGMFDPFDEVESAELRAIFAERLFNWPGGSTLSNEVASCQAFATSLALKSAYVFARAGHLKELRITLHRISRYLNVKYMITSRTSVETLRLLITAIQDFLPVIEKKIFRKHWVRVQANLGYIYWILSDKEIEITERRSCAANAISAFRSALNSSPSHLLSQTERANLQSDIGRCLVRQAILTSGKDSDRLFSEATEIHQSAVEMIHAHKHKDPVMYAGFQVTLGQALLARAEQIDSTSRPPLLANAIAAFRLAVEGYMGSEKLLYMFIARRGLYEGLVRLGTSTTGRPGLRALKEAIGVADILLITIMSRLLFEGQELQSHLAQTLHMRGVVQKALADHEDQTNRETLLRDALIDLENSLQVLDTETLIFKRRECSEAHERIVVELAHTKE